MVENRAIDEKLFTLRSLLPTIDTIGGGVVLTSVLRTELNSPVAH
jgi:hypothetical protein